MKRVLSIAAHICFIYLFILSVLYFQERTIFIDTSNYIMMLLNKSSSFLVGNRYAGDILLFIPWLFKCLGASLKSILISYSVSAVLIPYLVFVLIAHYYKQPLLAFAFALSILLCSRVSFYYISTEAHMVNVYAFWFFALLNHKSKKQLFRWIGLFLLCLAGMFCHPTFLFLYLFAILIYAINFSRFDRIGRIEIVILVFVLVIFSVISGFLLHSGGEAIKYQSALHFTAFLNNFFTLPAIQFLYNHAFNYTITYLPFLIVSILVIVLCFVFRKPYQALLTFVFIVFYLTVNNAILADGNSAIVLEKSFLPLAFFVCISFYQLLRFLYASNKRSVFLLLSIIFLLVFFVKLRDVSLGSKVVKQRLKIISQLYIKNTSPQNTKAIIPFQSIEKYHIVTWAIPYETMLKSTLDGVKYSRTVFVELDKTQLLDIDLEDPLLLLGTPFHLSRRNADFNPHYFHLKQQGYTKISFINK